MGSHKGEPQRFTSAEGQNGYLLLLKETEERQHIAMYLFLASYFHSANSFLLLWEDMSEGLVGGGRWHLFNVPEAQKNGLTHLHDTQVCELSD